MGQLDKRSKFQSPREELSPKKEALEGLKFHPIRAQPCNTSNTTKNKQDNETSTHEIQLTYNKFKDRINVYYYQSQKTRIHY